MKFLQWVKKETNLPTNQRKPGIDIFFLRRNLKKRVNRFLYISITLVPLNEIFLSIHNELNYFNIVVSVTGRGSYSKINFITLEKKITWNFLFLCLL